MKLFFSIAGGLTLLVAALFPLNQDPGQQASIWAGEVITTTTQSEVVACGQGDDFPVGRKTIVVYNDADSDGAITVTVGLRDISTAANFGQVMTVAGLAADSLGYDASEPTDPGGRFCQVSAISASTSTITVTLRRE